MESELALHELAAREIERLQAALHAKEPITLSDDAVKILANVMNAQPEAFSAALAESSKSIDAAVKQASKANTDHLKASTKAMDRIANRQDAQLREVLDQVRAIAASNPAMIEVLTAALKDLKPLPAAKPVPMQFDIERNRDGYMTSVIARPYSPNKPKPVEIDIQ